tara:strand:+ start:274 stop:735 length:462 start_codon:yes stop_codon:yes gene_type:complete
MTLLSEARKELRDNLDDGIRCPCCDKYARRYRRRFNSTMARSLIWLVRASKNPPMFVDVPKYGPRELVRSNQLPTVRWWGMVEREESGNPDLKHSGLWRPTIAGISFAMCERMVESTAVTYDGELEALEGELISIDDALGKKFSYAEIMSQYC